MAKPAADPDLTSFADLARMLEEAAGVCHALEASKAELSAESAAIEAARTALERESEQARAAVARQREEVELLRQNLEAEMAAMTRLRAEPNDLIGLNFGGEKVVTVKRSLLLQFEGTFLANMFSGRHEDRLDRDKDGNVFFDYSPAIMVPLIEYLRLYRDASPEERKTLAPPEIDVSMAKAWKSLAQFMGLTDVLCPGPTTFRGIRTDVKVSNLVGWTLFFCKAYSHVTTLADFVPPDPQLRGGSLLVAARVAGSDELLVAAMGDAEVVTKERGDSSTLHHNEVHWYCRSSKSVGFAPSPEVVLNSADTADLESALRLSWHLSGSGGWRAGIYNDRGQGTAGLEKLLFACPKRI